MSGVSDIGHFTPFLSFIYLFIQSVCTQQCIYLYACFISIIDYAFVGPSLKVLSSKYNLNSPRPLYPHMNGMPSGHTQLMWLLFVYFSLHNDQFHSVLFFIVAIYTSLQRITSGMHTPQQVIVGFFIGICMGNFWYFLVKG